MSLIWTREAGAQCAGKENKRQDVFAVWMRVSGQ